MTAVKKTCSGDPLDRDFVAELFEASDETTFEGILVAAVEEVGTEIRVGGLAIGEQVVGDHEDGVGDGDDGFLLAPARGKMVVLGAEVRAPRAAGGMSLSS